MRWGECLWSNYIWVIYGSSYRKFWVHELLVYIKVVQKVYKHGKFKGMWFTNPNFSMDPFLKLICPRTLLWPLSVLVTLSWSHKRKPDTLPIPVLNLWILPKYSLLQVQFLFLLMHFKIFYCYFPTTMLCSIILQVLNFI